MRHQKDDVFTSGSGKKKDPQQRAFGQIEWAVGLLGQAIVQLSLAPPSRIFHLEEELHVVVNPLNRLPVTNGESRPECPMAPDQFPDRTLKSRNIQLRQNARRVREIVGHTVRRQPLHKPQGPLTM